MTELRDRKCAPAKEGTMPMNRDQIKEYSSKLKSIWNVINEKEIHREFPFENFRKGMEFANKVAAIADQENHHPDMCVHYKMVGITLSTHNIGGLSENDFIMAAKIEMLQ